MKGKQRGKTAVLLGTLLVLLCVMLALPCHAIVPDGMVDNTEWWGCAKTTILQGDSLCGITKALVCHSVDAEGGVVAFGFSVNAAGCEPGAPVGAVFWTEGQVFARWHQGSGGSIDTANYSIAGAVHVPESEENFSDYYMCEIAISNKSGDHAAFFQMLRTLQLQLIDPQGVVSKAVSYPIDLPNPELAAQPTTTIKTTTTKTTTTKTTTTKAAITQKTTTTKTTTTTKPVTTTAKAAAGQSSAANTTAQSATAKNAEQKTSVIWYTVPITAEGGTLSNNAPGDDASGNDAPGDASTGFDVDDALLAEQMQAAQGAADVPVLLDAAPMEEPAPASLRMPLLFGSAGVLTALGVLLWFLWRKSQKLVRALAPAKGEPTELDDIDDSFED